MKQGYPIKFVFAFLKTISLKKIINATLLRLSYFLSVVTKKYIHWGTFESLSIEPINSCNLQCPECAIGSKTINRNSPKLSYSNFTKIIDSSKDRLIYLQLYFQGEPFIHEQIYDFINYAVKSKIFVSTSTNGHFLSAENCTKIVESGLHQIIISIDGTTQQIFEKYRKGGDLNTVLKGIKNLQKAKKSAKKIFPHIAMQFIVFSYNEHQIPKIKKIAKNLKVNELKLKTAQLYNFKDGNKLMPTNPKYNRYINDENGKYKLKRKKTFKCFRVWTGGVITSDMKMSPCCFDKSTQYSFGSIKIQNTNEVWKNNVAKQFRKEVWLNPNGKNICQNCTEGLKNKNVYQN